MGSSVVMLLTSLVAAVCLLPFCTAGGSQSFAISWLTFGRTGGKAISRTLVQEEIVGGHDTSILTHPYVVSVEEYYTFAPKWFHKCGGTIINLYHILSAAHCIQDEPTADYRVRAGSTNRGRGGVVVNVTKVFYHPKFNPTALDWDVGIFRLEKALVYSNVIRPVKFPKIEQTLPGSFNILGWGAETAYAFEYPTKLKEASVNLLSHAVCTAKYAKIRAVTRRMICATSPGKDTCTGDSGGPLMLPQTSVQLGITSWGLGCASAADPGVYTSLTNSEIRTYIASIIQKKEISGD